MGHFSAQRQAAVEDVAGRSVWFNPPWELSGHALQLVERAWRADPWGTHAVGVVPVWTGRWWYNRFIGRRGAPFRVIASFAEGTEGLFLLTGSEGFRARGEPPRPAGPSHFQLVMVEIGSQRRGRAEPGAAGSKRRRTHRGGRRAASRKSARKEAGFDGAAGGEGASA